MVRGKVSQRLGHLINDARIAGQTGKELHAARVYHGDAVTHDVSFEEFSFDKTRH